MGTLVQIDKATQRIVAVAASVILTAAPCVVKAGQITPNPNPDGSTIDIINDPFAVNNDSPFVNAGTIHIEGTPHIDSASILTNSVGATLTNTGTINNRFGTLMNAGTLNNFGSWEEYITTSANSIGATLNNYGFVDFDQGHFTNDGMLNNSGTFELYHARATNSVGATLNNYGRVLFDQSGIIDNNGAINNFGTFGWGSGQVNNAVGASLNNYGLIEVDGGTYNNSGTLNNFAGATLTNARAVTNSGTLTNTGTLNSAVVTNTGTLMNTGVISGLPSNPSSGSFIQSAGQTINNGAMSFGSVDIQGGSLRGTGTINAPVVTLNSGATLSPGDATNRGALTIIGNLQSSGDLSFRLGGLGLGQFDVLGIHGDVLFTGGTINFDFLDFRALAGESWAFLFADSIDGWKTLDFTFNGLSPDLTADFSYSDGIETLRLRKSVPEPSSLLLVGALVAAWLYALRIQRRKQDRPA